MKSRLRDRPSKISRSAPTVYPQVLGILREVTQSVPVPSMPEGPQGLPMVAPVAPPEYTHSLVYLPVASSNLHFWLTWLPSECVATGLRSRSTYWLKLARRTVRPSWVASQAAATLGVMVLWVRTVSPRLLSALA